MENERVAVFVDGDFPTGKECEFHCSPTCHPAQIRPEWVYGCTHPAWPQNRYGDFVPIVDCDGDPVKCEIPGEFLAETYVLISDCGKAYHESANGYRSFAAKCGTGYMRYAALSRVATTHRPCKRCYREEPTNGE